MAALETEVRVITPKLAEEYLGALRRLQGAASEVIPERVHVRAGRDHSDCFQHGAIRGVIGGLAL